jgi:hypothetical protein
MDHDQATRLMATEQYLLGELTPGLQEEFEEHFFGCQECALDLRTGAAFLEHSKVVLSASEVAAPSAPEVSRPPSWWQAWWRPAIALPVMALLLIVIGYQNLAMFPKLKGAVAAVNSPQLLPAISLINVTTRGSSKAVLSGHRGEPFLLFVDVPAESRFSSYVAELYGPAGDSQWSLSIAGDLTKDTLSIRVPGRNTAGVYTLVVSGVIGGKQQKSEVGRYPFELQFEK